MPTGRTLSPWSLIRDMCVAVYIDTQSTVHVCCDSQRLIAGLLDVWAGVLLIPSRANLMARWRYLLEYQIGTLPRSLSPGKELRPKGLQWDPYCHMWSPSPIQSSGAEPSAMSRDHDISRSYLLFKYSERDISFPDRYRMRALSKKNYRDWSSNKHTTIAPYLKSSYSNL